MTEVTEPSVLDQVMMRGAEITDLNFILSSWLKSYRKSDVTKGFSCEVYFEGQRVVVEAILKRADVRLVVSKEDPTHIYGWACFERGRDKPVLHYVYVKRAYRRFGLARMLISDLLTTPVVYTHDGTFKAKLAPGSYFNPYRAMSHADI